jgi:methionyl aminopeptidase
MPQKYHFPKVRVTQFIEGYDHAPITLHTEADFAEMMIIGAIASQTLDYIEPYVKVGISTAELDRILEKFMRSKGAVPATIDYHGYQHASCISIGSTVCHGIPSDSIILKEGDIVNIDVTPKFNNSKFGEWHGDTSRMYIASGKTSADAQKLCEITKFALTEAIMQALPGKRLNSIGYTCEKIALENGYSIAEGFCGHGIGQTFHAPPEVLHQSSPDAGPLLLPGMIFTIEPMLNMGSAASKILADGWTSVTLDNSLSAQYEHTIGITETGNVIFTL